MRGARIGVIVAVASISTFVIEACSGDSSSTSDAGDSATDVTLDVAKNDSSTNDAANDVTMDANDGGCPATWNELPVLPADAGDLNPPDGGALPPLLLHFAGSGTQDYVCKDNSNAYAWTLTGPTANLADCNGNIVGHHFASEAGASAPEWMTIADQSFVIGAKVPGAAYQPDPTAVAWLLLDETSNGGTGTISNTLYVQRLFTTGGVPPSADAGCAVSSDVGTTTTVSYTASYYFYGN